MEEEELVEHVVEQGRRRLPETAAGAAQGGGLDVAGTAPRITCVEIAPTSPPPSPPPSPSPPPTPQPPSPLPPPPRVPPPASKLKHQHLPSHPPTATSLFTPALASATPTPNHPPPPPGPPAPLSLSAAPLTAPHSWADSPEGAINGAVDGRTVESLVLAWANGTEPLQTVLSLLHLLEGGLGVEQPSPSNELLGLALAAWSAFALGCSYVACHLCRGGGWGMSSSGAGLQQRMKASDGNGYGSDGSDNSNVSDVTAMTAANSDADVDEVAEREALKARRSAGRQLTQDSARRHTCTAGEKQHGRRTSKALPLGPHARPMMRADNGLPACGCLCLSSRYRDTGTAGESGASESARLVDDDDDDDGEGRRPRTSGDSRDDSAALRNHHHHHHQYGNPALISRAQQVLDAACAVRPSTVQAMPDQVHEPAPTPAAAAPPPPPLSAPSAPNPQHIVDLAALGPLVAGRRGQNAAGCVEAEQGAMRMPPPVWDEDGASWVVPGFSL